MGIVGGTLTAIAGACGIMVGYNDSLLQKHRTPGKPSSAYLLIPMRWFDPGLYTADGLIYRKRIAQFSIAMLVAIAFAFPFLMIGL